MFTIKSPRRRALQNSPRLLVLAITATYERRLEARTLLSQWPDIAYCAQLTTFTHHLRARAQESDRDTECQHKTLKLGYTMQCTLSFRPDLRLVGLSIHILTRVAR
jgi:hypothetical protein